MKTETAKDTTDKPASAAPLTPLMQQYQNLKERYPEEILLFRLGDFYEMFNEDAKRASPILELALTHRQQVPMCGMPFHSADSYIARLLKAGLRVAVAEQMEDPSAAKGIVRRDVVRVYTAGTLQEDSLLAAKKSNFLAALYPEADGFGLSVLESSTGEFLATEVRGAEAQSRIWDELIRLGPSEVILPQNEASTALKEKLLRDGFAVALQPSTDFALPRAQEVLKKGLATASLRGFGLEDKPRATCAASAALRYLEATQCGRQVTLQPLRAYSLDQTLQLDANTLDHLDLLGEGNATGRPRKLLDILDQTLTSLGGRLMRRWLVAPLRDVSGIEARQQRVEFFLEAKETRRTLRTQLQGFPDVERILTRLTAGQTLPRDLAHLAAGLRRLPKISLALQTVYNQSTALGRMTSDSLKTFLTKFPEDAALADVLEQAVTENPPISLKDGGVIRAGYNAELDEVRGWIQEGKTRLLELEQREREQTGIGSLKVGFNNVFGYFIEVTRTHLSRVPMHYVRKQTMANGERYITPELKEFETRILGAEERSLRIETALVQALREKVLEHRESLRTMAQAVAELDVFVSLAEVAERRRYVKPLIEDSSVLFIREGRHPVLEDVLPAGSVVPNDVELSARERQIIILTGPNMSGKSTYLRQTALIVIMAQMGSFVPAAEARIGVLDQLFTRIGASDRLIEGESTFMVEMVETARILNHATPRSLVILDEVGRGTSTYDGIAIACACLEYLHQAGPRVLFATHYFELTRLAQEWTGVHNAHVTAKEWGDNVVFLHKVEEGPADRAYGIHVARLAGVPRSVLDRAGVLLRALEAKSQSHQNKKEAAQPELFSATQAAELSSTNSISESKAENDRLVTVLQDFEALDVNQLTPLQALVKLQELKEKLR